MCQELAEKSEMSVRLTGVASLRCFLSKSEKPNQKKTKKTPKRERKKRHQKLYQRI